ncbi:DEAD/DEAH box helicase, partial [bacterium]|nr:DEAD/DEAH box helicase [bacterium]
TIFLSLLIPSKAYNVPMNTAKQANDKSFHHLGINQKIVEYLDKLKFTVPTPIQHKAIPIALEGKDLVGIAQTGTGKTLAFGIPMVQILSAVRGLGLVIVPTRELALQVNEALRQIAQPFGQKTAVLIGGASFHNQVHLLKRNPQIIIATPGRLIDHLEKRTVLLFDLKILVLDEADRMFDMGFAPQIEKILRAVPRNKQTMLFSATMPPNIVRIATRNMQLPISIEIAPQGATAENITQELFILRKDHKRDLLEKLLAQYSGTVLVFARTKLRAKMLARHLQDRGLRAAEIHSDRSLNQRRKALEGFKSGRFRILVATDIAARGIDVTDIALVINYDLPDEPENYVHRIGRTARAGKEGRAISFATTDQGTNVKQIQNLIRMEIKISQHPEILAEKFESTAYGHSGKYRGGNIPRRFSSPRRIYRTR